MGESTDLEVIENWKPKVLVVGAALGAAVGLGAAYLMVMRAEREGERVQVSAGDGIKLGLLVFGLLRSVSQLGGGD